MPLSEKATRKQRIDAALIQAGWEPIIRAGTERQHGLIALEEYPTENGPADYALFHRERPLAIVEAKKLAVGPQNVLQQALRYASGLTNSPFDFNGYHVPFIYSTNGELVYFQDLRQKNSRSRQVSGFHTPDAMREMLDRDYQIAQEWLRSNPVAHPVLRPYQCAAIEAVDLPQIFGDL